MTVVVFGGCGFIGRRLVPLLVERDEEVLCVDIDPSAADFEWFGKQVRVGRGDISEFEDVVAALAMARKPDRVINLAYALGSEHPPHRSFRLNVLGMENCFEAARRAGVNRIVFASSLAVQGAQRLHGDRPVTEDDFRYGRGQYAMHKIFNEWQAQDYREKHGMEITAIRPANVTGTDKLFGSLDHVLCITNPARGRPVSFPYRDTMRCPIHVDEVADIFGRVTMEDSPRHPIYNTGGHPISLGELAEIVSEYLPDAQISFEREAGGQELAANPLMDCHLIDNSRLVEEFGLEYRPYRERVLQIINEVRREDGLALIGDPTPAGPPGS